MPATYLPSGSTKIGISPSMAVGFDRLNRELRKRYVVSDIRWHFGICKVPSNQLASICTVLVCACPLSATYPIKFAQACVFFSSGHKIVLDTLLAVVVGGRRHNSTRASVSLVGSLLNTLPYRGRILFMKLLSKFLRCSSGTLIFGCDRTIPYPLTH